MPRNKAQEERKKKLKEKNKGKIIIAGEENKKGKKVTKDHPKVERWKGK